MPNPLHVLSGLLAGLHDDDGRVAVPGFYDKVAELTAAERELFAKLPFDEKAWLAEAGNSGAAAGEAGFSTLERIWARPTAEINGMWGGHTGPGGKTIVPPEAHAKLSFRLVADQDPDDGASPGCASTWPSTLPRHRGHRDVARPRRPALVLADRLARGAGGPARRWSGRSAPRSCSPGKAAAAPRPTWPTSSQAPLVFVAVGLDYDRIHAPNERVDMELLLKGAQAAAYLWDELATELTAAG